MKKVPSLLLMLILLTGCASSERMFRMSGGILDEYSAPKSSRVRSEKYQKVSRSLSSTSRANKIEVAGMHDTLINIWPFFFRSNDYWSVLWPLIDKDPYGFAIRPFYNHEGDDYSVLFPLAAWNSAAGHGWVTLFGWNRSGFGIVPLTWQWREKYSGGWYYTPLFIASYDETPWEYTFDQNGKFSRAQWQRKDLDLSIMLAFYSRKTLIDKGEWGWIFHSSVNNNADKNEWIYRFKKQKPFPATQLELEKFCKEIYLKLPKYQEKTYGFFPIWKSEVSDKGDSRHEFLLSLIASSKSANERKFSVFGPILGSYRENIFAGSRSTKRQKSFTSWALLSHFRTTETYKNTPLFRSFNKLQYPYSYRQNFNQQKPAILDELKKIDPALTLPDTVVDNRTYNLFLDELWKKYEFPTETSYRGRILPFYWYEYSPGSSFYTIPALLTWQSRNSSRSFFGSIPLLTFISRSQYQNITTVLTPLVYWQQEKFRTRSSQPVFSRDIQRVKDYQCTRLDDLYIAGGLMYRGKFGFNIAKENVDAGSVEKLRNMLTWLPARYRHLENTRKKIARETALTDRWQTRGEIEKLKKLIRYEELKQQKASLAKDDKKYNAEVDNAVKLAEKLNFAIDPAAFKDKDTAEKIRQKLIDDYTDLRYYEDIGNGLFFRKEKNSNGDYNWHFCHILAGGEKKGDRESSHILHLLYRSRKEGNRSEMICFPFISSVREGENSRWSFLWRVFSISRENGKTGGYIFFVPFGSKW